MKGQKTGGRAAGTPNKVTGRVRECLAGVLEAYFTGGSFSEDVAGLEPRERVEANIKLLKLVLPLEQPGQIAVRLETEDGEDAFARLRRLSEEMEEKAES